MKRLLTTLLLVCSFTLVGCGGGGSPGDAVKDLAKAMEAGDGQKMKELVPALGETLSDEKIDTMAKEMAKEIEDEGGIESITIDKEEISEDGKSATVTATMKSKGGESETETHKLEKKDGKWVIVMDKQNGLGGPGGGDPGLEPDDLEEPPTDE